MNQQRLLELNVNVRKGFIQTLTIPTVQVVMLHVNHVMLIHVLNESTSYLRYRVFYECVIQVIIFLPSLLLVTDDVFNVIALALHDQIRPQVIAQHERALHLCQTMVCVPALAKVFLGPQKIARSEMLPARLELKVPLMIVLADTIMLLYGSPLILTHNVTARPITFELKTQAIEIQPDKIHVSHVLILMCAGHAMRVPLQTELIVPVTKVGMAMLKIVNNVMLRDKAEMVLALILAKVVLKITICRFLFSHRVRELHNVQAANTKIRRRDFVPLAMMRVLIEPVQQKTSALNAP